MLAGLAAGLVAPEAAWANPRQLQAPARIDVAAIPIASFRVREPERRKFGPLTFRGGLELTSRHPAFGGLSGISMAADGKSLVALSDMGSWLTATITYRGNRPAGLADARLAPILGADGRPLSNTRAFDTESLVIQDGVAHVGIERVNQVLRFEWGKDGVAARGRPIPLPPEAATLPFNRGLECLGIGSAGSAVAGQLVAIAERSAEGADSPTRGFVLGRRPFTFAVKRSDSYDPTDITFLPGGDMLLLERRFSPLRGVNMRMRRIPGGAFRAGAVVDGDILIDADMGDQIDNMEALGFHRDESGAQVLTILSDDNFSILQRTLLLQFALD